MAEVTINMDKMLEQVKAHLDVKIKPAMEAFRDLLVAVKPLTDADVIQAFHSAWEVDPHHDGEALFEAMNTAYGAALEAVAAFTEAS